MTFIDILLLVIIAAFIFFGFFFGLVHTIGSLIGTLVGIVVATHYVDAAFSTFGFLFGGGQFSRVVVFVILFVLTSRLIGLLLWIFERVLYFFTLIPFASTINRLLGAMFGFAEGILVVGIITFYAMQVLPDDTLLSALEGSFMAKYLVAIMRAMQVFFPESLRIG